MTIQPLPRAVEDVPRAAVGTQLLTRPAFYCPLPPRSHPAEEEIGAVAVDWLLAQPQLEPDPRQLRRLMMCDYGGLTARTMPDGQTELLEIVAKLHVFFSAFDDSRCDEADTSPRQLAAETSSLLRALEAPGALTTIDSPYVTALRELRTDLASRATPRQLWRWIEGMRVYLTALVWEAGCRQAPALPSLNDYVLMWMGAVGSAPCTALIDIVNRQELADEELRHPRTRALTEMTWTLIGWDNDLYSRSKELLRTGDNLNLVDVLASELGCETAKAQEQAVAMRDRVMTLFLRLKDRAMLQASPELRTYLDSLGQFIRGHLDWASRCSRYPDDRRTTTAPAGDWWTSIPRETDPRPLPIPTIAWWWGLDANE